MNDLDTRIREALEHVARTTRVTGRVDEIVQPRPRSRPGLMVAAAAFAAVLLVGLPALFLVGDPQPEPFAPASESSTPSTLSESSESPAVDPTWLTVDADDLAVFEQMRSEGASVHSEGWRPSLQTERVWCMYLEGPGADTAVSEFPIDQDLTREAIEAECGTGNDPARNLESPPDQFTFCRGVFAEDAYQEWTMAGGVRVAEGRLGDDRPGFPVVLGYASDCVSERLDTSWSVRLTADLSVEDINNARQIEIAVTGAANTNCFTYEEASALANAAREKLGEDWLLTEHSGIGIDTAEEGVCYQPIIGLQWGAIYVGGNNRASSSLSGTWTTLAPDSGQDR